ncbi:hypothetical protein [Bacteroides sp. 519]|uniref:hypothetical protein n=1 Tax=Bacteroides sp. 519 TaxID=2302937 RepID=UPI0013CF8233|nr:hypothetical protein [Bacteroides sp. 519]NDV57708.1 hypothetical protein [Bacteroides sp. 519]
MKQTFIISLLLCTIFAVQAQVKLESGLLIGGGKSNPSTSLYPDFAVFYNDYAVKNKFHFSLGYRFRLKPVNSRFFYDLDLNVGIRSFNHEYSEKNESAQWQFYSGSDQTYAHAALALAANYKIYKGLSVGAGVEPRYYFYQSGDKLVNPAIDIPIVTKLAYNFRFIEVGLAYKPTVFKSLKVGGVKSLRFNDWEISLYIPF